MQQKKLENNAKNRLMVAKLHSIMEMLLDEMLVRGFFGAGTIKLIVQDGTIQHLEECVERKHREEVSPGQPGAGRGEFQHQDNRHPKSLPPSAASIMRSRLEDIKAIEDTVVEHKLS